MRKKCGRALLSIKDRHSYEAGSAPPACRYHFRPEFEGEIPEDGADRPATPSAWPR